MSIILIIYFDETGTDVLSKLFVGSSELFHAFFSNIAYHLEHKNWGSRFPTVMNTLYKRKKLEVSDLANAKKELEIIKIELSKILAIKVIWDINNPDLQFSENKPHGEWSGNLIDFLIDEDTEYPSLIVNDLIKIIEGGIEIQRPVGIEPDSRQTFNEGKLAHSLPNIDIEDGISYKWGIVEEGNKENNE